MIDSAKERLQSLCRAAQPARMRRKSWSRQIGAWAYGTYAWCLFAAFLLVVGGLVILLRRPAVGRCIARAGTRILFRLAGMPLSATGLDRLPTRTHVLLVNHTSFVDALALIALLPCRPGYAFVVRQEFPAQRLLCPLLRALGTLVLPPYEKKHGTRHGTRHGKRHGARAMTAALQRGECLAVFPEGGFRPEPGLRPFHSGALVAASLARVPIMIAGLRGARHVLPGRTWLPRRGAIELEIGAILEPALSSDTLLQQLEAARKAMAPLSGEFLTEHDPLTRGATLGSGLDGNVSDSQ